jgi:iron complex transport system substrate-binding protein
VASAVVSVARLASAESAGSPLGYLLAAENRDGGFGSAPGQPSTPLYTAWAALALAADGRNPAAVSNGGGTVLAYIEATIGRDPGSLERAILVAHASGASPTDFGGHDLLAELGREIRRNGSVANEGDLTMFAVLALRAVGVEPPAKMVRWLVRQQDSDGGFSYKTRGVLADVDDTGAALEALAGAAPAACRRAVAFIRAAQNRDGGFPNEPGGASNAQSTSWAVQGLIADRVDPARVTTHRSPSPLRYLRSLITPSGAIDYARRVSLTPVWVTSEAIPALAGKPFPLRPLAP